ncbi:hypothetical protein AVEN_189833-1 [Araneus ventricosus]|uniref:Uncharacterized protein n=1 Tax=Araneus ventricosus TaxID=182803 RepID=A0A4Y2EBD3_ARAVE|nr:hypothetical protein AVEN_189833-1 [Araneus ventricosus]
MIPIKRSTAWLTTNNRTKRKLDQILHQNTKIAEAIFLNILRADPGLRLRASPGKHDSKQRIANIVIINTSHQINGLKKDKTSRPSFRLKQLQDSWAFFPEHSWSPVSDLGLRLQAQFLKHDSKLKDQQT